MAPRARALFSLAALLSLAGCSSSNGATSSGGVSTGGTGGATAGGNGGSAATSAAGGASGGAAGSSGGGGTSALCGDPAFVGNPLGVRCGQLVDAMGRVVFLRGVNARVNGVFDVSFSDGRKPLETIPDFTPDDAAAMRRFGFDALRLPINWSGLEAVQGTYDEAYLDRVEAAVDVAAGAGLKVLIDLHQDAYSKEIGEDGAPLWAIYPPPTKSQLLGGPLTDLGTRRLSDIVAEATDSFFSIGTIGQLIRKAYVAMATHVVARFAGNPAVIGLEVFNEPLTNPAALGVLHHAVYDAVRATAPDKLVVFEPDATRNFLDKGPIPTAPLGDGTAYAPHFYKLAFDLGGSQDGARMTMTKETLRPQVRSARTEADAWKAALVSTEWGYAPDGVRHAEWLTWEAELAEEYQASTFFWVWKEESQGSWGCFDHDSAGVWTERAEMKKLLARVRPSAVAGVPTSFSFDRASGHFELHFVADPSITGPHLVTVADVLGSPSATTCDGAPVTATPGSGSESGVLAIVCGDGDGAEHVLTVDVAALP